MKLKERTTTFFKINLLDWSIAMKLKERTMTFFKNFREKLDKNRDERSRNNGGGGDFRFDIMIKIFAFGAVAVGAGIAGFAFALGAGSGILAVAGYTIGAMALGLGGAFGLYGAGKAIGFGADAFNAAKDTLKTQAPEKIVTAKPTPAPKASALDGKEAAAAFNGTTQPAPQTSKAEAKPAATPKPPTR